MRNLSRNEKTIYYALYEGQSEKTDSDGLYTGEIIASYADPVELEASISASRGTSEIDLFGANISYTNTLIVDDPDCPINEHSRLWIFKDPETDPHNYEVVMVARSLNHAAFAVQQVDYSGPVSSSS